MEYTLNRPLYRKSFEGWPLANCTGTVMTVRQYLINVTVAEQLHRNTYCKRNWNLSHTITHWNHTRVMVMAMQRRNKILSNFSRNNKLIIENEDRPFAAHWAWPVPSSPHRWGSLRVPAALEQVTVVAVRAIPGKEQIRRSLFKRSFRQENMKRKKRGKGSPLTGCFGNLNDFVFFLLDVRNTFAADIYRLKDEGLWI